MDGNLIADKITQILKKKFELLKKTTSFAIVQVGNNLASNKYIKFKLLKAKKLGLKAFYYKYENDISEKEFIQKLQLIIPQVDGIIIQLPLKSGWDYQYILDLIPHQKDIDGLATKNNIHQNPLLKGIITMLKFYKINFLNKKIGIVGQSKWVGKPIADFFEKQKVKNVQKFDIVTGLKGTKEVDILIVAAGKANLIKKQDIKKDVVLIDVGINVFNNNQIKGDVDRNSVGNKPAFISPVPGGTGPLTVICLFENLYEALN